MWRCFALFARCLIHQRANSFSLKFTSSQEFPQSWFVTRSHILTILFVFLIFLFFVFAEVNENVADTQLDLVDTGAVAALLCVLQTSDAMIRGCAMEVFHTMSVLEVRNANKHKIPIRFTFVRVCTDAVWVIHRRLTMKNVETEFSV
jgi:hypothetical protein